MKKTKRAYKKRVSKKTTKITIFPDSLLVIGMFFSVLTVLLFLFSDYGSLDANLGRLAQAPQESQAAQTESSFGLWSFDETKGAFAPADKGSCGSPCKGKLSEFSDTSKQDATENSGWTKDNRFVGEGSLMFDGSDDYVHVEDNDKLAIPDSTTVITWVNMREIKDWSRILIWKHGEKSLQLGFAEGEKKLTGQFANGETVVSKRTQLDMTDFLNTWKQVALVKNGNDLALYIDGQPQDLEDSPKLDEPEQKGITLGIFRGSSLSGQFSGIMDEVGIYKQAHSKKDIEENFTVSITIHWSTGNNNNTGEGQRSNSGSGGGKIPLGEFGRGDDTTAACPGAVYDSGNFRIWYQGMDGAINRVYGTKSPDGVKIEKINNETPPDSSSYSNGARIPKSEYEKQDGAFVSCPTAIKEQDSQKYKMWYSGFDGSTWRIFNAVSEDANNWSKKGVALNPGEKGKDKDDTFVESPGVTRDRKVVCKGLTTGTFFVAAKYPPDEIETFYHMWYEGFDGAHWRIFKAKSQDGNSWNKDGVAIDLGVTGEKDDTNVKEPTVVLEIEKRPVKNCCVEVKRTYHMWYSGFDGVRTRIFYATSSDGNSWTKKGMVLDVGPMQTGDDTNVSQPTVVLEKKEVKCVTVYRKFHMWYGGDNATNWRSFKAESSNGSSWVRVDNSIGSKK